jgi:hypothetical protein
MCWGLFCARISKKDPPETRRMIEKVPSGAFSFCLNQWFLDQKPMVFQIKNHRFPDRKPMVSCEKIQKNIKRGVDFRNQM